MAPYMCWLFLIIFVFNKRSFANGRVLKSGEYKYLHQHPKLKSCAVEVFEETVYVGCRVHVQKGDCEGLNHSWAINQTTESGYAYAKKQWVESSFIPPIELSIPYENTVWNLPGVLSVGSKVETTVTVYRITTSHITDVVLALTARDMDSRHLGSLKAMYTTALVGDNEVTLTEEIPIANGSGRVEVQRANLTFPNGPTKETKVKITFLSLTEGLKEILFEDHFASPTLILKNLTVDLTTVKDIKVYANADRKGATELHGFKFTSV